jgi:glycosyltransferase involved in cell wall biosynthesis
MNGDQSLAFEKNDTINGSNRKPLTILFTGDYLPDYNRTTIIEKGLVALGHRVIHAPFQKFSIEQFFKLKNLSKSVDFVFCPSFTHREIWFVRMACGRKTKIFFDPLISRYLTKVHDYQLVSPYGISAMRNFFRDKWSMMFADHVFTDTKAHLEFFHKTFGIQKDKMSTLYIGNDFDEFFPNPKPNPNNAVFRVGFYGGFIPLQGVMNILEAAKILADQKDIEFVLIGNGFEFEKAKSFVAQNGLQNVQFPGWLKNPSFRSELWKFDLALGVFGDKEKTDLVIPNKIYHYASCKLPIITKDTSAIRELFTHGKDLYLVAGDPKSISDSILLLKNNDKQRALLAQCGFDLIYTDWNAKCVGSAFVKATQNVTS